MKLMNKLSDKELILNQSESSHHMDDPLSKGFVERNAIFFKAKFSLNFDKGLIKYFLKS